MTDLEPETDQMGRYAILAADRGLNGAMICHMLHCIIDQVAIDRAAIAAKEDHP